MPRDIYLAFYKTANILVTIVELKHYLHGSEREMETERHTYGKSYGQMEN